jgi:predicted ferric reductase
MIKLNKHTKYFIASLIFGFTILLWGYTKIVVERDSNLLALGNLAQILSISAVILFALNFILATRMRFVENLFLGLDKMYKSHKLIARLAFTFAWAHPILILIDRFRGIESIQTYFIPGENLRMNAGIFALYLMTLLVLFSVTKFLPYHIWKNTHRFMVFVLVFLIVHMVNSNGSLGSNLILKIWVIGWAVAGILSWIYIEFFYKSYGPVFYYKVSKVNKLGSINELYLEPQNKPLTFVAGQFVFLSFLDNKSISNEFHPYTISSNPHDYSIRISAKNLGDYTSKLVNAEVGNLVKLIGPYGYFTKDRLAQYKNQIWIAGGIGVTPFLSMLAMEKDEPSSNNINFFYTAKTESEAVYKSEIVNNSADIDNFNLIFNTDDKDGFLTADKIAKNIKFDIKQAHILLCGPKAMMYSLRKQFKDLGVKDDQIIFEDFALKPV